MDVESLKALKISKRTATNIIEALHPSLAKTASKGTIKKRKHKRRRGSFRRTKKRPSSPSTSPPSSNDSSNENIEQFRSAQSFTQGSSSSSAVMAKRPLSSYRASSSVSNLGTNNRPVRSHSVESDISSPTQQELVYVKVNLNELEIHEKISSSSSTPVYSAVVDGWKCAMKEIPVNSEQGEKLLLEIKTLQSLPAHPNVIRYLFHTLSSNQIRLFTTLYSRTLGEQLYIWREANDKPSIECVINMTMDLVKGICFLHRHDIIHRDIKSANVFVVLTPYRSIKKLVIGDFDSCKDVSSIQNTSTLMGTRGYMAPEIDSQNKYNKKVDIWSLGIVLYEILTLDAPPNNIPHDQIRSKIINELKNDQDTVRFLSLVDSCLSLDPEKRPSAPELLGAICELMI
eukprot:CAMPEP_0201547248 /NCGR_PEP_ID=MMETSP0173_2-20130828/3703_1 /ASSEMBLY_ACC=CAM_ASM_000268 /TAXON_ID=218659 /ORGANISM="Vexillifera sp., Strain DIVA3 564/2" /LENGTH=399 /DNA_ID=CAMNT_0047956239 /DNA_START=155 /DNA_END=1354 /DNA_ORIENTATION=-